MFYLKFFFGAAIAFSASLNASAALDLQKKADILREEGKSLEAVNFYNHSIVKFQEEGDFANITGALTGRLLCWKHLYYKTEAKLYAIMVKKEAEALFRDG